MCRSAGQQSLAEGEGLPRELEEELGLENRLVFATVLASGLADKVGEQGDKLESSARQF